MIHLLNQSKRRVINAVLDLFKTRSVPDMARALRLGPESVRRWKRGEVIPDTESLIRLRLVYGLDLNALIDGVRETNRKKES